MEQDREQLRVLAIFHYVVAGLGAFASLLPGVYLVLGLVMTFVPRLMEEPGGGPPLLVGMAFSLFGAGMMVLAWLFALLVFLAGRDLASYRRRTFCLVMAGIECLFMPFGTVLGIFTIVVLMRDSVVKLFDGTEKARIG